MDENFEKSSFFNAEILHNFKTALVLPNKLPIGKWLTAICSSVMGLRIYEKKNLGSPYNMPTKASSKLLL